MKRRGDSMKRAPLAMDLVSTSASCLEALTMHSELCDRLKQNHSALTRARDSAQTMASTIISVHE
jgi:hypothetical protein